MRLKLAFSPCPNDTFAFCAIVNNLVDCEGLSFDIFVEDVESLNKGAARAEYDVCKMSYHAFFHISDKYAMLRCGSALGYNNGPLLVTSQKNFKLSPAGLPEISHLENGTIAIPGDKTTAALLLGILFPSLKRTEEVIFSQIEQRVLEGEFDAGVIIHEGRFTYSQKGLSLIADLGHIWQEKFSLPVPLGGIAISRRYNLNVMQKMERVLRRSIVFALENPSSVMEYVNSYAKELSPGVIEKHISLYVNSNTIEITEEGKEAVKAMFSESKTIYPQIKSKVNLFIL